MNDTADNNHFTPTASMRKYARACTGTKVSPDDESRCHAAGVTLRALARWRSDPCFCDWLRDEVRRRLSEDIWEVWAVVNRLARNGNLPAAKLFLDQFAEPGFDHAAVGPDTFQALADLARETAGTEPAAGNF